MWPVYFAFGYAVLWTFGPLVVAGAFIVRWARSAGRHADAALLKLGALTVRIGGPRGVPRGAPVDPRVHEIDSAITGTLGSMIERCRHSLARSKEMRFWHPGPSRMVVEEVVETFSSIEGMLTTRDVLLPKMAGGHIDAFRQEVEAQVGLTSRFMERLAVQRVPIGCEPSCLEEIIRGMAVFRAGGVSGALPAPTYAYLGETFRAVMEIDACLTLRERLWPGIYADTRTAERLLVQIEVLCDELSQDPNDAVVARLRQAASDVVILLDAVRAILHRDPLLRTRPHEDIAQLHAAIQSCARAAPLAEQTLQEARRVKALRASPYKTVIQA